MKIVCISDTHSKYYPKELPEGDVLVHAGDCIENNCYGSAKEFLNWFSSFPHKHKLFIAGNHDFYLEDPNNWILFNELLKQYPSVTYLLDSEKVIDGIKFYGAPRVRNLPRWAFHLKDEHAHYYWSQIPLDTNVLITHSPPYKILDKLAPRFVRYGRDENIGCDELMNTMPSLRDLKLHIFGHIHEARGQFTNDRITWVNASMLDEDYKPYESEPFVFDLKA